MVQVKRILLVPDCKGWCWWHQFCGIQKYAPEWANIDIAGLGDRTHQTYDAVVHGSWAEAGIQCRASSRNVTLLAHHGVEHVFPCANEEDFPGVLSTRIRNRATAAARLPRFSAILCVNKRLHAVGLQFNPHAVYCHPGVDDQVYRPGEPRKSTRTLRVGWCGQAGAPQKGYSQVLQPLIERMGGECEFVINARTAANPLSVAEMVAFYRSCDVFLCTSFSEGTPMPPLEAMSCGVPVISTRCGSVEDMVEDRVTGIVCGCYRNQDTAALAVSELEKSVRWCIDNREDVRQMGVVARARVEQYFSWASKATDWVNTILGSQ